MERFSRWRDPATGIQPFLPPVPPSSNSAIAAILLTPSSALHALSRAILIAAVALVHVLLVDGACLILIPLPPLYRLINGLLTSITCRLALCLMGYWWIETEMASSRRGSKGVDQITNRSPRRGDLIITNWTSYVDLLYLAFRHNPTFLLPVFSKLPDLATPSKYGRHTGTGSASISTTSAFPQPPCIGYIPITLFALLARTGRLPFISPVPPAGMYKTLKDARRKERRAVALLPEGTTSNGRALLKFGDGVLQDDEFANQEGIVWVKYIKHTAPTPFAWTATCSIPRPLHHLFFTLLWTPTPFPSRSMSVRTLHPISSPSSPSFLPSEILASTPEGMKGLNGGRGAWREAISVVLSETGRVKRVGLGWAEKFGFLEYYQSSHRR